jgi:hypothetical protein
MSHVRQVRDPLGGQQTRYEFGPVEWTNGRFESFRRLAGWSPPKRGREPWQPPAVTLTYVIDIDTGRLAANG